MSETKPINPMSNQLNNCLRLTQLSTQAISHPYLRKVLKYHLLSHTLQICTLFKKNLT